MSCLARFIVEIHLFSFFQSTAHMQIKKKKFYFTSSNRVHSKLILRGAVKKRKRTSMAEYLEV